MVFREQFISAEEFVELVQLPEYRNQIVELVCGEIVTIVKPGGLHGVITGNISGFMWVFVREHQLGYVTAAETGFILIKDPNGRDTVRGLGVAFVSKARAPEGLPTGYVTIAPDLAVEVISPGNSASDINKKIRELLQAGTVLVWIVYPDTLTVDVHTANGSTTFEIDDMLDGGDVLPGFKLPVRDIFPA